MSQHAILVPNEVIDLLRPEAARRAVTTDTLATELLLRALPALVEPATEAPVETAPTLAAAAPDATDLSAASEMEQGENRNPMTEMLDFLAELRAEVPDQEWERLPTDLSEQHDHYLYGTPKR